jgi:hypothetical protein
VISKPTTAQLVEAACSELATKVAPVKTDGLTRVVLDITAEVLGAVAVWRTRRPW